MNLTHPWTQLKGGINLRPKHINRLFRVTVACLMVPLIHGACSPIDLNLNSTEVVRKEPVSASDQVNPVIFLHGTMGSRLVDKDTGRVVWGDFSSRQANAYSRKAVRGLALSMEKGRPLEDIHDSTEVVGYLEAINISLLRVLNVNSPVYGDTASRFGDIRPGGEARGLEGHGRRLDFYFDWRRSYDENARLFAEFMQERKRELIEEHGFSEDMKFNIVAHSQGALIFKYYLRYGDARLPEDGSLPELTWAGAADIDKIIYIGIPSGGVVPTLDFLTNGHQAHGLMPRYEAAVVGTMPAIYQMIPRMEGRVLIEPGTNRVLDPLDYNLWVRKEWGLANPKQDKVLRILLPDVSSREERRAIALDHLRKCLTKARRIQESLDRPGVPPARIKTIVCVSDSEDTMAGFYATQRHISLARTEPGDGTVTLRNAIKKARSVGEVLLFEGDHLQIVTAEAVNRHISRLFEGGNVSSPTPLPESYQSNGRLLATNP